MNNLITDLKVASSIHRVLFSYNFKQTRMILLKTSMIQFSSLGVGVFIFLFFMYTSNISDNVTNSNLLRRPLPHKYHDPFSDIEKRIKRDKRNIKKMCEKYLSSIHPFEPDKPNIKIQNYYMNKDKKVGWCVNPKVRYSI